MAKKVLRAPKPKMLYFVLGALLLVALGFGVYYMYQQNNLGTTASDASGDRKVTLRSSSISDTSLQEGDEFEVKCDYAISTISKGTADGIYVVGEGNGVTCERTSSPNTLYPGKVTFTCTADETGKYALGCGIKQGTNLRIVTKVKTCYINNGKDIHNNPVTKEVDCNLVKDGYDGTSVGLGKNVKARTRISYSSQTYPVDFANSYKIIDYVTVGNPTGSANCVVPAYVGGELNKTTISKKNVGKVGYTYKTTCIYAAKTTLPTSSVKADADLATCGATVAGAKDVKFSTCTPKSSADIGDEITTSCNFVSSTIDGVKFCEKTDELPGVVTILK